MPTEELPRVDQVEAGIDDYLTNRFRCERCVAVAGTTYLKVLYVHQVGHDVTILTIWPKVASSELWCQVVPVSDRFGETVVRELRTDDFADVYEWVRDVTKAYTVGQDSRIGEKLGQTLYWTQDSSMEETDAD